MSTVYVDIENKTVRTERNGVRHFLGWNSVFIRASDGAMLIDDNGVLRQPTEIEREMANTSPVVHAVRMNASMK